MLKLKNDANILDEVFAFEIENEDGTIRKVLLSEEMLNWHHQFKSRALKKTAAFIESVNIEGITDEQKTLDFFFF